MAVLKKSLLSLGALATALALPAPVFAGGGHRHHPGCGHGHYAGKHHGHGSYYYGSKHYRRHHHRDGLSGGEAALIAAGIIGGVILIDRAMETGRYQDRDYERGYDPYEGRGTYYGGDPYYGRERYYGGEVRDFAYRRDDRYYVDRRPYDDLDGDLAGGGPSYGGAAGEYNYGAAYNDCKAETRDAARDSGMLVALPAKPRIIDPIEGGEAVRFTVDVMATDLSGAQYRRTMTCEADAAGVRFLEII